jgi:hypothetical protein
MKYQAVGHKVVVLDRLALPVMEQWDRI